MLRLAGSRAIPYAHSTLTTLTKLSHTLMGITSSTRRKMASASTRSRFLKDDTTPNFIYGTAWKKRDTDELVKSALDAGFRKIDTAAQPRHYDEKRVGQALRLAYKKGIVNREDIYLQTKYTTPAGQDLNNMPYHPLDSLPVQIHTSIVSSLKNLSPNEDPKADNTNSYLDCVLLHSPLPTLEQTLEAWKILEHYVPTRIRSLGISNVTLPTLEAIFADSKVKPAVVQNRFYPRTQYDAELRAFCDEHAVVYQSFWTLTGNPHLLKSKIVRDLAFAVNVSSAVALYALVMDLGVVVLNGTTKAVNMEADLWGVNKVKEWARCNEEEWVRLRGEFEGALRASVDVEEL